MAWLVVGLAVIGLVIATSFTAAFYWPASPLLRLVPPEWCGLDPNNPGCGTVVQTPGARIFGVPNSLLGILFYLATLTLAATGFPRAAVPWHVAAAWFTVGFGVYLGYRLLRVERMSCPLCWTSHALNTVLAIVLTVVARNRP